MTATNGIEAKSVHIMHQCRRYDRCSVPICPLDLLQNSRIKLPGEPGCTLPKSLRYRIGREAGLRLEGLTKREWAANRRWQGLTEAEKETQMAKLRPFRRVVHGAGVSGREGEYYHALDQNTCTNTGKTSAGDISS